MLIAEDEALIRFAVAGSLTDQGVQVYEAGTAEEAIEILASHPEIDLVFSDIRMPGQMDGIGLARWVHANRPGLAVVLTSGNVRRRDLSQDVCANGLFFEKPYDLNFMASYLYALAQARMRGHVH